MWQNNLGTIPTFPKLLAWHLPNILVWTEGKSEVSVLHFIFLMRQIIGQVGTYDIIIVITQQIVLKHTLVRVGCNFRFSRINYKLIAMLKLSSRNITDTERNWWYQPGCLFPRKPVNFVRRKCSNLQEIFRNMNQNVKLFDSFNVQSTI